MFTLPFHAVGAPVNKSAGQPRHFPIFITDFFHGGNFAAPVSLTDISFIRVSNLTTSLLVAPAGPIPGSTVPAPDRLAPAFDPKLTLLAPPLAPLATLLFCLGAGGPIGTD